MPMMTLVNWNESGVMMIEEVFIFRILVMIIIKSIKT